MNMQNAFRAFSVVALAIVVGLLAQTTGLTQGSQPSEFKIAAVSFLSGAAAAPFGVPARNAVELLRDKLNAGAVPAPYDTVGIGGVPITLSTFDESGGAEKQVEQYRSFVGNFDVVLGYISSGDCGALAPVVEEVQQLTVFADCGTNTIFEEKDTSPAFLFRTHGHQVLDSVGAARYVLATQADLSSAGGINQNYSWGQDNWSTFSATMAQLAPSVQLSGAPQFPALFAGEYSAEISALLQEKSDAIFTSFWGGDLEALIIQGTPRGLFDQSTLVMSTADTALPRLGGDIPEGVVIGGRGPHGALAPDNALNAWFTAAYQDRFGVRPVYSAYHYAQAVLGLKTAYEKAIADNGSFPDVNQVISAFEGITFDTPSGTISLTLANGHQAVEPMVYGTTGANVVNGERELVNVLEFPAGCVNPPEGTATPDWVAAGLPTPAGVDCAGTAR